MISKRIVALVLLMTLTCSTTGCATQTEPTTDTQVSLESTEETTTETVATTTTESSETTTVTETEVTTTTEADLNPLRHKKYKEALLDLYNDGKEINGYTWEAYERKEDLSSIANNAYAIADVDLDGKDELILCYNMYFTMTYRGYIYEYDPETDKWNEEFCGTPYNITFYDNGTITHEDAKNQNNYSDEVFPYTISRYNSKEDKYEEFAHIGCFDKEYFKIRDLELPDSFIKTDKEKAGIVYELYYGSNGNELEYKSKTEYKSFLKNTLGKKIKVKFKSFKLKNIKAITNDNN